MQWSYSDLKEKRLEIYPFVPEFLWGYKVALAPTLVDTVVVNVNITSYLPVLYIMS